MVRSLFVIGLLAAVSPAVAGVVAEIDADGLPVGVAPGRLLVSGWFNGSSVLYSINPDGSVSGTTVSNHGGAATVLAMSDNGRYIVGFDDATGHGLVWSSDDLTAPTAIGYNNNPLGVNDGGVAVGDWGASAAIRWTAATGVEHLASPSGFVGHGAIGVSADGSVIVGASSPESASGNWQPAVWDEAGWQLLPGADPRIRGFAAAVSSNGRVIGGLLGNLAAVWLDRELVRLKDAEGENFRGMVLGVTDNGYAIGTTDLYYTHEPAQDDSRGFIWHPSFESVMWFDDWAAAQGLSLPGPIKGVRDVMFDGTELHFALEGSVYYAQVSVAPAAVPEPSSLVLCGLLGGVGLVRVWHRRWRT